MLPIPRQEYKDGLDIRPTISQTKSHIKIPELDALFREGKITIDGTIVQKTNELPAFPGVDQGIEVAVSKVGDLRHCPFSHAVQLM